MVDMIDSNIIKVKKEKKKDSTNPEKDSCNSFYFERIKFVDNQEAQFKVTDNYDK